MTQYRYYGDFMEAKARDFYGESYWYALVAQARDQQIAQYLSQRNDLSIIVQNKEYARQASQRKYAKQRKVFVE